MIRRLLLAMLVVYSHCVGAAPRIAILDFELKDLTLAPSIPAEIARTASIKPLIEQELAGAGYEIINIPKAAHYHADAGVGYLFDHPDVAAQLGKQYRADYVLVGRLHKPSYLFAYLMANLADVQTGNWHGQFISESKGPNAALTIKAVESLSVKIDNTLDKRYIPPAPSVRRLHRP